MKENKKLKKENKELKKENKPLTWIQIQKFIGKPIWDNRCKVWRVLRYYSCGINDGLYVKFTDGCGDVFKDNAYYLEEVE